MPTLEDVIVKDGRIKAAPVVPPFSTAVQFVREAKRLERTRLLLMQRAEDRLEAELKGKPPELREALLNEYIEAAGEVVVV